MAFHTHVGSDLSTSYGIRQYAMVSVEYIFHGATAHAASRPWAARSAADAVKLMDLGFDVLREHLSPTHRSHSVIVDAGLQPNVVPDYAKIWWYFRESTPELAAATLAEGRQDRGRGGLDDRLHVREERHVGGLAHQRQQGRCGDDPGEHRTGRDAQMDGRGTGAGPGCSAGYRGEGDGLRTAIEPLEAATQGTSSNDSGDVTWAVPHGRISFPSNVDGTIGHHWSAAIVPATSIAHKGEVAGAKVLAASVIDMLTSPDRVAKAKKLHEEDIGGAYTTLLPADAKPPLELNQEEMQKYRALMEPYYFKGEIRFR